MEKTTVSPKRGSIFIKSSTTNKKSGINNNIDFYEGELVELKGSITIWEITKIGNFIAYLIDENNKERVVHLDDLIKI